MRRHVLAFALLSAPGFTLPGTQGKDVTLSDFWPHGRVALSYNVLRSEGIAERAIFVIDKDGIIRYMEVHDIN